MDSDSSNYIGFKAPSTLSTDITYILPSTDGSNGQVLTTNGSGTLSFTTINQVHNNLTGIQGGTNTTSDKYYHSDQEINIASSPSFAGMTIAGFTFPTTDGSANYVLTTNGSKGLSFSQVSHANLSNLQGGTTGSYYHSNQQIDNTSDVTFKSASLTETLRYNTSTTNTSSGDITSVQLNSTYTNVKLNPSAISVVHGINGGTEGKIVILQNISGYNINIANNSSTETSASKRIYTGAGEAITLRSNASITLMYDNVNSVWRVLGLNKHNFFYDLQGGGSGNYYHSNQQINSDSSVQFGSVNINGAYSFPTTLGTNGQALISNGSALVYGTAYTTLDPYIIRYSASLNLNATTNLATITGNNNSGKYEFWFSSDPRVRGTLYIKSSDLTNTELEISSSIVSSIKDTASCLNVYYFSDNIVFQNKIANDTLVILKKI
jgi:hypothetical protein